MNDHTPSGPSVLLSFRARNVRSFRDELEFSLIATGLAEEAVVRQVRWREGGQPVGVLPLAGIFGANASGKTNVLRAMSDMRTHVLHSFRRGTPTGGVPCRPFLLDPGAAEAPSSYEIDLILDGVRHEYGFSLNKKRILDEWAYRYPHGRQALLFHRRGDDVEVGAVEKSKSRAIKELLRPNALFLSTAASANHPVLLPLYGWFEGNLLLAQADTRSQRQAFTAKLLDDVATRNQVLALLRAADLGITGASKQELDAAIKERLELAVSVLFDQGGESGGVSEPLIELDDFEVRLSHQGTSGDVELEPQDESLGTLVWFGLVGPVVDALSEGSVLLADELDASLHPALVEQLVRLFQDPETNPHRAQLVFNSHDVTILGDSVRDRVVGRDQVWFTEKLDDGSTRLYPLSDLDPRKDEAIARRYLAGRYGAVPIISRSQFHGTGQLITSGEAT
jgi:uncharacterized protein